MKKHHVKIWYHNVFGKDYVFDGYVNERIGNSGKAVVYPNSLFKKVFGFDPPAGTIFTLL